MKIKKTSTGYTVHLTKTDRKSKNIDKVLEKIKNQIVALDGETGGDHPKKPGG